jgi:UDP-glucose 4-epimerase
MTVIALSGASGFLGRHLGPELLARGHRLIAIPRAMLDSKELATALAGAQTVIHLAARAHVLKEASDNPQPEFWRANVGLTQNLAVAAMQAGVKRFVFVSSAGVLGASSPRGGFNEESSPHPHDAYSASKLQAEQWLTANLGASMELAILRPPLIYGPGAKGNLMRLLRFALQGWPLPIGALRAPRSMVAARNIVDLISILASDAKFTRTTMLVADRETISVADLFRAVAHYAGHRPWLAPLPPVLIRSLLAISGRTHDIDRLTGPFVLNPNTAQLQFDWVPPYPLQSELQRTVICELEAAARQID